jgi:hypothetical protein
MPPIIILRDARTGDRPPGRFTENPTLGELADSQTSILIPKPALPSLAETGYTFGIGGPT